MLPFANWPSRWCHFWGKSRWAPRASVKIPLLKVPCFSPQRHVTTVAACVCVYGPTLSRAAALTCPWSHSRPSPACFLLL